MKRSLLVGVAVIAVAGFVAALYQYAKPEPRAVSDIRYTGALAQRTISIHDVPYIVDIADTPALQARGLSGRSGLAPGTGMLFVFPHDDLHTFWMKDMRFSIDIIWIAADGRVVDILHRVSPDTYPQSFGPDTPSRYVLELDAGVAESLNLNVGDMVEL